MVSLIRVRFKTVLAFSISILASVSASADHGGGSHINVNLSVPATSSNGNYTVTWNNYADPTIDEIQYLEEKTTGSYYTVYSGYSGTKSFSSRPNGTYTYRVRHEACFGFFCNSQYSAPQSIVVGSISPPATPTNLTVPLTGATNTNFTVSWSAPSGTVSHYEILRNGSQLPNTTSTSVTQNLSAEGLWTYQVRACNSGGCSNYTSGKTVYLMEDNITTGPTLQTAAAVGTVPYAIDVDGAGNAIVSVPIEVIPGVAGHEPKLSIRYGSGRGVDRLERSLPEDTIGYGWWLDGIASIRRCVVGQTSSATIQLNNSDSLCLNGVPLTRISGTHLATGAQYKTAIESFAKIEIKYSNGAHWFEVSLPDGTRQEYGRNRDTRVTKNGGPVYEWSLANQIDAYGNVINFSYYYNASKGINYVTNITYTDVDIEFYYENRSDAAAVPIGSASQQQNALLHTVRVKYDEKKVREYRLIDEVVSGDRRLSQVQLCGFDQSGSSMTCLEPIETDWLTPTSTMAGVEILLDGLSDGLGAVYQIEYGTITGSSHPFLFSERPFGNGTPPANTQTLSGSGALRHVATKLRRDNGLGGFHDTTFAYQGVGLKSTKHWGFLGFYAQRAIDQQSGITSYTQFRLDYPHFGEPAHVVEYDAIYPGYSNIIAERTYRYATRTMGYSAGSTTYPYVSNAVELHYEGTTRLGASQQQNTLTFTGNLIDRLVSTQQTGTGVTTSSDQSPWGNVVPIGLSGILGTTTKTVDFTNRTTSGKWLIGFADSLTTESWNGVASGAGIVQEVVLTPESLSLNVDTVTRFPSHATLTLTKDFDYDGSGRRNATTISGDNVSPRTTSVVSFLDGRYLGQLTNELGHNTNFSNYDVRFGTVEVRGDPNGRSKSWARDPFGRVTSTTDPDGVVIANAYSDCSSGCSSVYGVYPAYKIQTTTMRSSVHLAPIQNAYYDVLGREIRNEILSFDGTQYSKRDTKYDSLGRIETQSLPYFSGTPHDIVYTYDVRGRVKTESRPDGSSTTIAYSQSANQRIVTTTDTVKKSDGSSAGTQVRREEYNLLGQLTKTIDGYGSTVELFTTYAYDAAGRPESVAVDGGAAGSATTTFDHDEAGNRLQMVGPEIGTVTSTYTALGELKTLLDNKGQQTTYTYDALGRQKTAVNADGTSTWTWDTATNGVGKIASRSQNSSFVETFYYNTNSRLSSKTTQIVPVGGGSATTYTETYAYDAHGRALNITYAGSAVTISRTYNPRGYLSALKHNGVTIKSFNQADQFGNTTQESYGNGVSTTRAFDPKTGRLTDIDTIKSATKFQDNTYKWRSNGTLENRLARPVSGISQTREEKFQYDVLNRLTLAETFINSVNTRDLTNTYDDLGNLKGHVSNKPGDDNVTGYNYVGSGVGPHGLKTVSVNGTTYTLTYDANGAVTRYDISGSSNDKWLAYNVFNQPTAVVHGNSLTDTTPEAKDEFAYDPDGNRYYRKTTWQEGTTRVEKVAYVGRVEIITDNIADTIDRIYKTPIGENVMHVKVEGTDPVTLQPFTNSFFEYAHRDHLGSIEVVTDSSGNVLDQLAFEPFGARKAKDWSSNASSTEIGNLLARSTVHSPKVRGFTGHEHLDRTGFIHMNGRVYDPLLGRFMSPDPVVQSPTYSQSWNRYSYVFNQPSSAVDLSGYVTVEVDDGGFFGVDYGWSWIWGTIDYYDPVAATNGGPLYVPDEINFGDGRFRNENLDSEIDFATRYENEIELAKTIGIGVLKEFVLDPAKELAEGRIASAACKIVKVCSAATRAGKAVWEAGKSEAVRDALKRFGEATRGRFSRSRGSANVPNSAPKPDLRQTGSYTNTHASGATYSGKGSRLRSQQSGRRVAGQQDDSHVATDWSPAGSEREAFKQESLRIDQAGGVSSPSNYNRIESPGRRFRIEDGEL